MYFPEEDSFLLSDVLIEKISKYLEKNPDLKFLEIGCGSGIQLKTVLKSGVDKKNILGVDINPKSVKYCKNLGFNCIKSDLFSKIDKKKKFDIIIFNPPYLPLDEKEAIESQLETTGGKKGSEVINRFILESKKYIKNKGKIFLVTSSLTKGISWKGFIKKKISNKKLFFEEIYVWELNIKR